MARLNKNYFETLIGENVIFKEVNGGEDIRVEFTDRRPDYTVKISDRKSARDEELKVKIVKNNGDVKLEIVDRREDFTIYMR